MKIIDLLNKIANGEEVPKKIKYNNIILSYDKDLSDYYKYYGEYLFYHLFGKDKLDFLNNEVEILEEEKKIPEKLEILPDNEHYSNEVLYGKINEIIDYLKSKGK